MKVKSESEVAQSCLTLRDPMDCSLPGSSVHGILQARVLEWGAIAFSEEYILLGPISVYPVLCWFWASPTAQWIKRSNAGDTGDSGSIPGLGRSPGGGNGNPFQYSCLENPMDTGAWRATVRVGMALRSITWGSSPL